MKKHLSLISVFLLGIGFVASLPAQTLTECELHSFVQKSPQQLQSDLIHTESPLWEVTNAQGQKSYLFGTLHSYDREVLSQFQDLVMLLDEVDTLVSEIEINAQSRTEFNQLSQDPDQWALKHLSEEAQERVRQLAITHRLDPKTVLGMAPWSLTSYFSRPPQQVRMTLDLMLLNAAGLMSKKKVGLESVTELVGHLESMTKAEQGEVLLDTLCNYDLLQSQVKKQEKSYSEYNLYETQYESLKYFPQEPSRREKFMSAVVWQRNLVMWERMKPLLSKERAFVAIGSVHLSGEKGLVEIIKKSKDFQIQSLSLEELRRRTKKGVVGFLQKKQKLIETLYSEIEHHTSYELPRDRERIQAPEFHFLSQSEMEELACDGFRCSVKAFYSHGHMYMAYSFYPELEAEQTNALSILLHELTHHIQEVYGPYTSDYSQCDQWVDREKEARYVQMMYRQQYNLPPIPYEILPLPKECR